MLRLRRSVAPSRAGRGGGAPRGVGAGDDVAGTSPSRTGDGSEAVGAERSASRAGARPCSAAITDRAPVESTASRSDRRNTGRSRGRECGCEPAADVENAEIAVSDGVLKRDAVRVRRHARECGGAGDAEWVGLWCSCRTRGTGCGAGGELGEHVADGRDRGDRGNRAGGRGPLCASLAGFGELSADERASCSPSRLVRWTIHRQRSWERCRHK